MKLSDLGEIVSGGTPSTKHPEYWNGNISWITPRDLSSYGKKNIFSGERNITELGLEKSSAKLIPKNSILFTSRAPIGYIAIAGKEMCTNQGFKSIICNNKICNYMYIYYWLINNVEKIKQKANGSTFKEINANVMKNIEIELPNMTFQNKIAKILSNIDDKIELNNQINNNLQNLSQELYKSWFVDFEFPNEEGKPYKSSGGEMRESELGEIPEGWEVGNLGDILETNKRGCSPKYTDDHDGIPVINQRCIRDGIIIEEAVKYHDKSKLISEDLYFKKYDILINSMGVGTLGRVSQVSFSNEERLIHSCITILRSKPHIYDQLILGSAVKEMQSLFESMGNGTTGQTSLNNKEISNLKIVIPPLNLQKKLSKILKNNLDKITANYYENKSLINLRDTLLPKLLNGEIDLEQIEV